MSRWPHEILYFSSVINDAFFWFSSVAQSCPTLCDPMSRSMPGLPVHHQLQSSLRLMSIESAMPSSHLILCHPLLLLPPIPPSIRVFSNESTLRIRCPKYWSFSFNILPKSHLNSYTRIVGSGWMTAPSWLLGQSDFLGIVLLYILATSS